MEPLPFPEDTTIHGIRNMLTVSRKWKIAWLLVISGAVAYGTRTCAAVVVWHLGEPTYLSMINEPLYRFPDILYCPTAWINVTKAHELGFDDAMISAVYSSLWHNPPSDRLFQYLAVHRSTWSAAQDRIIAMNKTASEIYLMISYDKGDVIKNVHLYPYGRATNYTLAVTPKVTGVCYSVRIHDTFSTVLASFTSVKIFTLENPPLFQDAPDSRADANRWAFGYVEATSAIQAGRQKPGKDAVFRLHSSTTKLVSTRKNECGNYDLTEYSNCFLEMMQPICQTLFGKSFYNPMNDRPFNEIELGECNRPTVASFYEVQRKSPQCTRGCDASLFLSSSVHVNDTSNPYPNTVSVTIKFSNPLEIINIQHPMYSVPTTVSQVGGILGLWTGASFMSLVQVLCFLMRRHATPDGSG